MYRSSGGSRGGSRFSFSKGSRFAPKRNYQGGRYGSRNGVNDTSKYVRAAEGETAQEAAVVHTKFADMPLSDIVKQAVAARGFDTPTPIQEQAIPHIMEGRDVIGIANTGTGKTGAFLLPLIEKILKDDSQNVLVVVPTRELGQQILEEMREFSKGMRIYSALVIGGANMRNQIMQVRRNPHIVVGTPGRLKDLIDRRVLNLAKFQNVVLDEVDRMVDMGFIQDIRYLISLLPKERQSLFFSATISPQINSIIQSFLKDPITVSVRTRETSKNVEQNVVKVAPGKTKIGTLEELLEKDELKKVLIFGRTKHGVERLSGHLYSKGFKVVSLHGDKPQSKREQAIRMFKNDSVDILIATDVAARGLDIADVTHVINYDEPATYDDYIHRIGRTGRGDKKGHALTFVG